MLWQEWAIYYGREMLNYQMLLLFFHLRKMQLSQASFRQVCNKWLHFRIKFQTTKESKENYAKSQVKEVPLLWIQVYKNH